MMFGFSTNGFYISTALRNPFSNSSWLLGRLPLKEATQQLLFPLLFELLFKPSHIVRQGVEQILRLKHQQLTCLHIRMGKNPSNPSDAAMPARINMTTAMINFLDNHPYLARSTETLIFVTSDSDQAVIEVLQHFPNSSVTVPGPIVHIDHLDGKQKQLLTATEKCAGLVKVVTDFYILGECQVSLLSYSGFSAWANRRRTNPNELLFLYHDRLKRMKRSQI